MAKMHDFAFELKNVIVCKITGSRKEAWKKGCELAKSFSEDITLKEYNEKSHDWEFLAIFHPDGTLHYYSGVLCRPSSDFNYLIWINN